ncbi:MAG: DUF4381 domain-containing protein [Porticoccaceae bacterium]|nr:DUF4381 domain-containing protein [Porticoccaceae bacterium]
MNNEDPLSELRDIHLPDAISMWPPAPGWFLIIALAIIALLWLVRKLSHRHRSRLYRRQALQQLQLIIDQDIPSWQLQQLFTLLRQTAHSIYEAADTSSLGVDDFINFLQSTSHSHLFDCDRKSLKMALYASTDEEKIGDYQQLCSVIARDTRHWILQHRISLSGTKTC